MTSTIDAHQHFWQLGPRLDRGRYQGRAVDAPPRHWNQSHFNYDWLDKPELAPIRRDYLPPDLKPHLQAEGVDYSIFVQTQHNREETLWAFDLSSDYPFIAGVVGWVDLTSENCESELSEFLSYPKFVGIRHVVQDEPDDDFLIRDDVLRGLKTLEEHGVPFDLLLYVKHLRHVSTLARALPDLPMVIDHLAKPRIKEHATEDWLAPFREASTYPNIYCKLSGMVTEADWRNWTADDLRPYVQAALESFGPDRLMFGSDWPVCELAASYGEVRQALVEALGPISESERSAIFGGTASRFYRLA
jgi:L-fuconolactonase